MASEMSQLASQQEGFIAEEHVGDSSSLSSITISYWRDLDSIRRWKQNLRHLEAQRKGKELWYQSFSLKVAKVERAYDFDGRTKKATSRL
jgi:heme-degrading monooxygenase HmoA